MIATNDTATREITKPLVQVNRLERDRIFSWLGLGFALAVSAVLNLWNLAQNGYSNLYYSVAVQSMLQSWHNFFFASYDAGGFITVDKPPGGPLDAGDQRQDIRLQRLAACWCRRRWPGWPRWRLLYFLVRAHLRLAGRVRGRAGPGPHAYRRGGRAHQQHRYLADVLRCCWRPGPYCRATEKGQFRLLALGLALVGVAFNIKMLAAFIVLPTFFCSTWWPRRSPGPSACSPGPGRPGRCWGGALLAAGGGPHPGQPAPVGGRQPDQQRARTGAGLQRPGPRDGQRRHGWRVRPLRGMAEARLATSVTRQ